MIPSYQAVRATARRIARAADRTIQALREGRIEHEPAVTDRMLGAIEESLQDRTIKGIHWTAKTLTDRSAAAQEPEFGADFFGVLNIDLPDLSVSKGFLAQAKLVRGGEVQGLRKLQEQCERMLAFSPDSFVFLYSHHGIRIVPAVSVTGGRVKPTELYGRSIQRFFEHHLECFIGDRAISSPTPAVLDALRSRVDARSALFLRATTERQAVLEVLTS